jgi:hypothetical protein
MPAHDRSHYRGDYARRAARVRANAYLNSNTKCWRCGMTLEQVQRIKPHAKWDAGHVRDGEVGGSLMAECSPCNRSAGAALRNTHTDPHTTW